MTVKTVLIDILSWSVEASTSAHHALGLAVLPFLPYINLVLAHRRVKGNHGKLGNLSQLVQLGEEHREHAIIHRSALVDADRDLGVTGHALTRMDTRIPLVQAARRGSLVAALARLHEVAEHFAPVDFSLDAIKDVLTHARRDGSPVTGLLSLLGCLLERILEPLLRDLGGGAIAFTESIVIVEAIGAAERIAISRLARARALAGLAFAASVAFAAFARLVLHVLESLKIPLVGLASGQVSEGAFAWEAALHGLAGGHHRARIGLARELVTHLRQTVDREVHRDIIDALKPIGRFAPGHVLENDVIELVHQDAELMLVAQLSHKLRVIEQLELGALWIDADARSRDRGGRGLVDPTRESREEGLTHQETRGVHVQVKGLVSHVELLITSQVYRKGTGKSTGMMSRVVTACDT